MERVRTFFLLSATLLGCAEGAPAGDAYGEPVLGLGLDAGSCQAEPSGTALDAASAAPPARDAGPTLRGACASAAGKPPEALHAAAAEILTSTSPCGFSSCHTGRGKAGLSLLDVADLRAQLVGRPACEAPALSLVDGSGGEAALEKSWLWLKLTAETDAAGALQPVAGWGTPLSCGQSPSEPHGLIMPFGGEPLLDDELTPVREWICAGAPGP